MMTKDQMLPDFLQCLFWEVEFSDVRFNMHKRYVIERILEYGDDQSIKWLRRKVAPKDIAAVVKSSREISPNTAALWALILDISNKEIACLSIPSPIQH
jgi:hypothetical protein